MSLRTDLAIESYENAGGVDGADSRTEIVNGIKITTVEIKTDSAAECLSKPKGIYITADVGDISGGLAETNKASEVLAERFCRMLNGAKNIVVVGVGNGDITPDALGPRTANGVLATRHISGKFAESIGLFGLNSVSVLSPNVLGKTGIEAADIVRAAVEEVHPDAVIAVDALSTASADRIGNTVQINNAGIAPGSGVGNHRREISRAFLGVPVIAVGVPTVCSAENVGDRELMVTIREIDLLISRASELLSHSINFALQPNIEPEVLLSLV